MSQVTCDAFFDALKSTAPFDCSAAAKGIPLKNYIAGYWAIPNYIKNNASQFTVIFQKNSQQSTAERISSIPIGALLPRYSIAVKVLKLTECN